MENIISAAIWIVIGASIAYLIGKRIKDKRNEDFEDRDN